MNEPTDAYLYGLYCDGDPNVLRAPSIDGLRALYNAGARAEGEKVERLRAALRSVLGAVDPECVSFVAEHKALADGGVAFPKDETT